MKIFNVFSKFKTAISLVIPTFIVFALAQAGSLSPLASPAATSYTLSDIYTRLTTNTSAIAGSHSFSATTTPTSTFQTLTDIYNAIPTIYATDLLATSTYLGITGTIAVKSGDADASLSATSTNKLLLTPASGYYNGSTATVSTTSTAFTAANIRSGTYLFGLVGSLTALLYGDNNANQVLTTASSPGSIAVISGNTAVSSSSPQGTSIVLAVPSGYYSGVDSATVSTTSTAFTASNIKLGTYLLGIIGTLYGDTDASKVLTTASGAGTYNAASLSTATVKKSTSFGVSSTGAYSGYPGSGANRDGLTQATCEAASASGWYWFEDANGDGDSANPDDPEDGICVLAKAQTTVVSWNGYDSATNPDATYIADYTCDGVSFPNGSVTTYGGIDSAGSPDTTWNQGDCALCQADCYDGVKDLPGNGGYKAAPGNGGATTDYNGPLTPKVLAEWKGTRLPTSADFFGFCGRKDGVPSPYNSPYDYENTTSGDSSSNTYGNYGVQVGRTDEFLDLANTNWEWLSEQHYYIYARIASSYGCSNFHNDTVNPGYSFRAVFRP